MSWCGEWNPGAGREEEGGPSLSPSSCSEAGACGLSHGFCQGGSMLSLVRDDAGCWRRHTQACPSLRCLSPLVHEDQTPTTVTTGRTKGPGHAILSLRPCTARRHQILPSTHHLLAQALSLYHGQRCGPVPEREPRLHPAVECMSNPEPPIHGRDGGGGQQT